MLIAGAGTGAAIMPLFEKTPRVSSSPKSYASDAGDAQGSATEEARTGVFSQTLAAPATVEANGSISATLYRDELAALLAGYDTTRFAVRGEATQSFLVEPSPPISAWDESSVRVRFIFVSDASKVSSRPEAGTLGVITARLGPYEALVVPDAAVLHDDSGPYVMVASPDAKNFEHRAIEIGRSQKGVTFVTSGLAPGERIATGLACFVDAERRLSAHAAEHTAGAP